MMRELMEKECKRLTKTTNMCDNLERSKKITVLLLLIAKTYKQPMDPFYILLKEKI